MITDTPKGTSSSVKIVSADGATLNPAVSEIGLVAAEYVDGACRLETLEEGRVWLEQAP